MTLLTKFWEDNKGLEHPEQWAAGNTYVNHWEMPSYMLSVENKELQGGGTELKAEIWDAAVDSVREWTGQDLTTSSLYGIRVYKEGAVLAPHVDRLPLVSSAIINVAQVCNHLELCCRRRLFYRIPFDFLWYIVGYNSSLWCCL
jgi:prolyl 4-hydroxylase